MLKTGYGLSGFGAKPPRPASGPIEISIRALRKGGVAPFGAHFEVMITGGGIADKFRDAHVVWDFGDPGATFDNLGPTAVHGADANSAIGPHAAHVYLNPGVYTPSVTVYWREGGAIQSATATGDPVTVADPDAFFPIEDTVACSLAGDFTGAPAGAAQATTVEAMASEINARRGAGRRLRLLFRGGETYVLDRLTLEPRNVDTVLIERFGAGLPVFQPIDSTKDFATNGAFRVMSVKDCCVRDVEFAGGYDPTTATIAPNAPIYTGIFGYDVTHITTWGVKSSGVAITIYPVDFGTVGSTRTIANSDIRDWANYGVFGGGHNVALIGNSIRQNPATLLGYDYKQYTQNPLYADHGPARLQNILTGGQVNRVHIYSKNDLYSRSGWSGYGARPAIQPALRIQLGKDNDCRAVVTQNTMEGGYVTLWIAAIGGTDQLRYRGLIEANYLKGDEQTDAAIDTTYCGALIRNNVVVKPDMPEEQNAFASMVSLRSPGGAETPGAPPTRVEHNTIVNEQSAANIGAANIVVTSLQYGFSAPHVESANVLKADNAPNAASLTAYDPLDATDFYRPLAGSPAIGAATQDLPIADFFGTIRGAAGAVGAVENL